MKPKTELKDAELLKAAKGMLAEICEANRYRSNEIPLGVDGEREHAHEVLGHVIRIRPEASSGLKLAALFHNIDRVATPNIPEFKGQPEGEVFIKYLKDHAKRSSDIICPKLTEIGADAQTVRQSRFLISHHEDLLDDLKMLNDPELTVLAAAEALSFFTSRAERLIEKQGIEGFNQSARVLAMQVSPETRSMMAEQELPPKMAALRDKLL